MKRYRSEKNKGVRPVNNKKSYLQMLRELLDVASVEIEKDDCGNYNVWLNLYTDWYHADTLEHAIQKAWENLVNK